MIEIDFWRGCGIQSNSLEAVPFRIDQCSILAGELDCTVRGKVRGWIDLVGWEVPLVFDLEGLPKADLVGRKFTFRNPAPEDGRDLDVVGTELDTLQVGHCGDMTTSERCEIIKESPRQRSDREEFVEPPASIDSDCEPEPYLANLVVIEWYPEDCSRRYVIELIDVESTLSDPEWQLDPSEIGDAAKATNALLDRHIEVIKGADPPSVPEGREMSEFEWEAFMKASDRRTDAVVELHEKFGYSAEADNRITEIMGWGKEVDEAGSHPTDFYSTDEEGLTGRDETEPDSTWEAAPFPADELQSMTGAGPGSIEVERNPLSQRITHLLQVIGQQSTLDPNTEEPRSTFDFEFALMRLSAKLAGALDRVTSGEGNIEDLADNNFTVACLKRCLPIVDEVLAAAEPAGADQAMIDEILAIRQEVMDEMTRLRTL